MLSDSQIDRYCRQIVLPEIGGRGQERLLEAVAAIHGVGDAAVVCARYLSGAGVGRLWSGDAGAPVLERPRARGDGVDLAEMIGDRNPDCRVLASPPEHPSVAVWISPALPDRAGSEAAIIWGGSSAERAVGLYSPPGGCGECVRAAAEEESCQGSSALLGTLLALLALRALLGLEEGGQASRLRLDLVRLSATRSALPRRPGCGSCGAGTAGSPRI